MVPVSNIELPLILWLTVIGKDGSGWQLTNDV
jgi:hypothetical protein